MDGHHDKNRRLRQILYFFPIQLLLLHFKRNHLVLIFWAVLFAYVTGNFGGKYGIPYLFLAPEYLGEVNFLAFGILGFACGGFIMSFNIYSYIMHGYKFHFIATVAKPFFKFSLNNFIIPLTFVFTFLIASAKFQIVYELMTPWEVILNLGSFLTGILVFFVLSFFYFFRTNRQNHKLSGTNEDQPFKSALHNKKRWYEAFFHDQEWNVHYYISSPFLKINMARDADHYDKKLIRQIMAKNSINASYFEILMIASFILLGTFKEYEWVRIPAGASIILLFTIMLMVISILYSWLKGWTMAIVVTAVLLLNWGSNQTDLLRFKNYAYGLNYQGQKAPYTEDHVFRIARNADLHKEDIKHGKAVLRRWKARQDEEKPKLVFISTSGGGLRSMLWTFEVIQELDKATNGALFHQTHLLTGSSGGMIGAAYYRELYAQDMRNSKTDRFSNHHREIMGKDLLNSVALTIATSDMFPRIQSFNDGKYTYSKDRAYMFEDNLNDNTSNLLKKRMKDYKLPVSNAEMPMMILAPTIVNDGKRLLICSQPISYMSAKEDYLPDSPGHVENIEFTRFFEGQDAWNLRFTSALRMNATFPYVFPMVTLPASPSIEVMDAGLRDNYGIKDIVKYLETFEEWIQENTSGVLIVEIRDRPKNFEIHHEESGSLLKRVLIPFSNVYGNILKTQDYNNDHLLDLFLSKFKHPVERVSFHLMHSTEDHISLSWHLTQLEKRNIHRSVTLNGNKESLNRVKTLLNND